MEHPALLGCPAQKQYSEEESTLPPQHHDEELGLDFVGDRSS